MPKIWNVQLIVVGELRLYVFTVASDILRKFRDYIGNMFLLAKTVYDLVVVQEQ